MLKLIVCLLVVLPVIVAWTRYDKPILEECPSKQSIYWIKSRHHNRYEDREWEFHCRSLRKITTDCQWYKEINSYDKPFHFQCPRKGAIVGVNSYHSDHHEDRIWSFKCCNVRGAGKNCLFSSYVNNWDAVVNYRITPRDKYLSGIYSIHHNHYEDRRWKFETCRQ